MQQSRLSRLPQLLAARSLTWKSCISNSRSTRKSRLQPNGPPTFYSWRQPLQAMQGTCRTLFSTKSKASTPIFPTKGCGVHPIRPLRNKLWPWLPNSNKPNPKGHRLPRKKLPPSHHQKTKIRRKTRRAPHSHKRKVNWVTQNNGMARHITTVPPTTNTAIGIPIRLRNVTLTRR